MPSEVNIEDKIKRKGLELGFSHVGIAPVRDYEELWDDVLSRPDYRIFSDGETSLMYRITHTKTLHPNARSVVCATLGYGCIEYPENLSRHVARTYLSRRYTPPADMRFGTIIDAFGDYLEDLGLNPDRNQFSVPQRLACAEAGITTYGRNNFAYTPEDGSFNILVTFLVERKLESDEPTLRCDCPPNCDECQLACPRNRAMLDAPKKRDLFLEMIDGEFDLERVLLLDDEYYEEVVKPIMYNYIKDMDLFRRNAAVALGNSGDSSHVPALLEARDMTGNENVIEAIDYALEKLQ